ncbi:MAG: LegC family aminotransferase [Spirochaetaceae bacterium]
MGFEKMDYREILRFIRELYSTEDFIPLHVPHFGGNEKAYLHECIDSTFVSSVGKYVDKFEEELASYIGSKRAVAVVNGTSAIQVALRLAGVKPGEEVITQPLTFVATCNAVRYLYAEPVFVDVDRDTMGLSPERVRSFLAGYGKREKDGLYNRETGRRIAACLPMHTFGHPARIEELNEVCREYDIPLIEDAAESIGSYSNGLHTGRTGLMSVFSFNGNKTITTGGGGMICTDNEDIADKAKYLTTTAKKPHKWEFYHDELGYNFRMPNINAALGCAQLEMLPGFLENKRQTALEYKAFFDPIEGVRFVEERENTRVNYWLNCLLFEDPQHRDEFLHYSNEHKVMTRPIWTLMYKLPMYKDSFRTDTANAEWLEKRVVNIPSSVR